MPGLQFESGLRQQDIEGFAAEFVAVPRPVALRISLFAEAHSSQRSLDSEIKAFYVGKFHDAVAVDRQQSVDSVHRPDRVGDVLQYVSQNDQVEFFGGPVLQQIADVDVDVDRALCGLRQESGQLQPADSPAVLLGEEQQSSVATADVEYVAGAIEVSAEESIGAGLADVVPMIVLPWIYVYFRVLLLIQPFR